MSTSAVVCRATANGIQGRIVGADGYPDAVGQALFFLRRGYETATEMIDMVVDGAPQGYRSFHYSPKEGLVIEPYPLDEKAYLIDDRGFGNFDWAYVVLPEGLLVIYCGQGGERILIEWDREPTDWYKNVTQYFYSMG